MSKHRQEKSELFFKDAINKMLELAGHKERYEDLEGFENWWSVLTMTREQEKELGDWFVAELRKRLRTSKTEAIRSWMWFNMNYGLKIEKG